MSEDLVGQLQQEARLEGSGRFSLDLRKAGERIVGLENRPGLYLLKLVQAAVAAGAREIQIRLGRSQVEFRALGPPLFDPAEVNQAIQGPLQSFARKAVEHLAWALLLVRPVEDLQWELPVPGGFHLSLRRHQGIFHWLAGLGGVTQEHALLYERCAYAPIPIKLDGRRVNSPNRLEGWISRGQLKPPTFFQFVPFHYSLSEILVERNLLQSHSPQALTGLPTQRTVRNLRVGSDVYPLVRHTMDQNLSGSHVQAVHLCQWLHDAPDWAVEETDSTEIGLYPMAQAMGLGGGPHLLTVRQEQIKPYLSEVPSGLPHPYNYPPGSLQRKLQPGIRYFERNLPLVNLRLLLPLGLDGPGRLLLVQHGVALDPYSGTFIQPGLAALAAVGDQIQTDLSQLRPVLDEAFQGVLDWVTEQADQMVADFWELAADHYPEWVLEHIKKRLHL